MASNTIQRNALISPFPVKTPFIDESTVSAGKGANSKRQAPPTNQSGISRPHTVWLQQVENAGNASVQITATIPVSSASPGQPGTIAFDSNWLYLCVGLNIWRRVGLNSF
jgi:hypothetical protein